MSSHQKRLRKRLSSFETRAAPAPWLETSVIAVGGLAAVGFSEDSSAVLVVSSGAGRSLYDARTGERLGRDRNNDLNGWMSADGLTASGIAEREGERFRVSGVWGGGLPLTGGGWSCRIVAPMWPVEHVVLQPPGREILIEQRAAGCTAVADSSVVDLQAAGFSWDGTIFVVATSADLTMWRRVPS